VHVVMCGDVTGINGPLVKNLHRNDQGRNGHEFDAEDLLKVYGEPTSRQKLWAAQSPFATIHSASPSRWKGEKCTT
jgi:hypothetical protein